MRMWLRDQKSSSKCLDLSSQNVGWEIVEEHKFLQCYQM